MWQKVCFRVCQWWAHAQYRKAANRLYERCLLEHFVYEELSSQDLARTRVPIAQLRAHERQCLEALTVYGIPKDCYWLLDACNREMRIIEGLATEADWN